MILHQRDRLSEHAQWATPELIALATNLNEGMVTRRMGYEEILDLRFGGESSFGAKAVSLISLNRVGSRVRTQSHVVAILAIVEESGGRQLLKNDFLSNALALSYEPNLTADRHCGRRLAGSR
jgi:hypothetical protein